MLSFLKLSIFGATVAALSAIVSSEVVSNFCTEIEKIKPCDMENVLEVSFGKCGTRVSSSDASNIPGIVDKNGESDKNYLIIMVDPDAPTAKDPVYRYWRHWVALDFPRASRKSGAQKQKTLSKYSGPSPPRHSGPHRYQIFLFGYQGKLNIESVFNDKDRGNWNVVDFIQKNDLCTSLVAGYEFISENSD